MNNNENSNIIDQNKRKETLIIMARKKTDLYEECGRVTNTKDDINKITKLTNTDESNLIPNDKSLDILNQKRKREKVSYDPEIDPKIRVVEYIYTNEKKNLNRNTILRVPIQTGVSGFENLLTLCLNNFTRNISNKASTETCSFLEELTTLEFDLQQNKAIIIVPPSFNPGNLCMENARKFLVDAQYLFFLIKYF